MFAYIIKHSAPTILVTMDFDNDKIRLIMIIILIKDEVVSDLIHETNIFLSFFH